VLRVKRAGRQYGRPLHDVDNESFAAECLRETGYPPEHYGDLFRFERSSGLNAARGGLPADARLARAAVRLFGACVVDVQPMPRGLHPLVDWEVFALMRANYEGRDWVYTGQVPFVGKR
jgi:hypothetical protein